jgi:hypothetical protein
MKIKQTDTFRLPFSDISTLSIKDAIKRIQTADKIRLHDLKMFDLILDNGRPMAVCHGVYLYFSEENKCLYVGKNESRSFIERIPDHFALHPGAWMNYFLRYLRDNRELASLEQAALVARNCTLLIIPVEEQEFIAPLERLLRADLEPEFNMRSEKCKSRYKEFTLSGSFGDLLKREVTAPNKRLHRIANKSGSR